MPRQLYELQLDYIVCPIVLLGARTDLQLQDEYELGTREWLEETAVNWSLSAQLCRSLRLSLT